jgi:hypothetical protein
VGKALPISGVVAFLDLNWSDKWTSTIGYSFAGITNSDLQAGSALKDGHYALANILFHPAKEVFLGPEVQWGKRINNSDGFSVNDYKIQFSAKYSFSYKVGG